MRHSKKPTPGAKSARRVVSDSRSYVAIHDATSEWDVEGVLKGQRKEFEITLVKLGEIVGISSTTIGKWKDAGLPRREFAYQGRLRGTSYVHLPFVLAWLRSSWLASIYRKLVTLDKLCGAQITSVSKVAQAILVLRDQLGVTMSYSMEERWAFRVLAHRDKARERLQESRARGVENRKLRRERNEQENAWIRQCANAEMRPAARQKQRLLIPPPSPTNTENTTKPEERPRPSPTPSDTLAEIMAAIGRVRSCVPGACRVEVTVTREGEPAITLSA